MDKADAVRAVVELVNRGRGLSTVMPAAIDLCREIGPSPTWDRVAAIDWGKGWSHDQEWLEALLTTEPPDATVTGYWFGIFNPVKDDLPASDFYVTGSGSYPAEEWFFEQDWEPSGRYAKSPGQTAIYRAAAEGGPEILGVADYVVTFAHACATINDLIGAVERNRFLAGAPRKGIAVGFDSGDALFLGEVTPEGVGRSGAAWL